MISHLNGNPHGPPVSFLVPVSADDCAVVVGSADVVCAFALVPFVAADLSKGPSSHVEKETLDTVS